MGALRDDVRDQTRVLADRSWRVELFVDKQRVAAGRFAMVTRKNLDAEIRTWLADRSAPTHHIAPLGGRVTSLRLFADDGGRSTDRRYTRQFPRATRIGWDLDVAHAAPRRWVPLTFEARWLETGPGIERLVARTVSQTGVAADWRNTRFSEDSGPSSSRGWPAGNFRLDVYLDGKKVASEPFEIR
jgi:hypothetical protein